VRLTLIDEIFGLDDDDGVTGVEINEFMPPQLAEDIPPEYLAALKQDLISCARKLVNACRASGQRRSELHKIVLEMKLEAHQSDSQNTDQNPPIFRAEVLLHDVDTRWSSIYLMIDRLIELYLVHEFPSF